MRPGRHRQPHLVVAAGADTGALRVGGLAPRSLRCDDPVVSAAGLSRSPRAVAIIASGVAAMGILAASWAATHLANGTFDPTLALLGYELVLLLVAVAFPLAVRAVMRARGRLAD